METLFQFLFEEKYLLISNSAAEAIQSLFNQKNKLSVALKDVLLQVSLKMTSLFEQKILEIQINNFFDVLYDILLCFEGGDNNFFKAIFKNLCKRVNMQVERHFRLKFKVKKETNKLKQKAISQTNLNSYKIIVNKCFNLIRLLMDNEIFVIKNLDLIEESLKPLVDYMENPNKIDFDEDLVAVIYLIIKYNKKVTGLCFSIIKNLYKYCDKLKGLYPDTYKLVNAYLAYGTDQILSNKVWYEGIFKVFNSGIKREERTNKSVLFTCILIQTWIMNCNKLPNDLLKELFDKIIKSICNIVQIYNKNNELNEEMYNYVGYVSTVMSAFINYSPLIISSLQKGGIENNLVDLLNIVIKENDILFEYEIKIIIISICFMIEKGMFNNNINSLLNISIDLLECQLKNCQNDMKKETKKELDLSFIEDKSYDEDSEEDERNEIKDLIKYTVDPYKSKDEFTIFINLLNFLKNNRSDLFSNWHNSLNENQQKKIKNLIGTKRIDIELKDGGKVNMPRRIISIKRSQNPNNKNI
jgi:hypothetical protein